MTSSPNPLTTKATLKFGVSTQSWTSKGPGAGET